MLTGNVTSIAGSDYETGSAVLLAKGNSESRINLSLSSGNKSDIRNSATASPQGAWVDTNGVSHAYAGQNCLTDAVWFFPGFSSLAAFSSNPNVVLSYIGQESLNGMTVQHIRSHVFAAGQPLLQRLSAMDFYLDSVSLLPMAIAFDVHSDTDAGTNIPVVVNFANYQVVNGIEVPFHVQRMLNGVVVLDVIVTSAAFNTGLPDSSFSLQ
jgi:hypothetical protein